MAEIFRFNDTLVDAIIGQDGELANEIERRLEQWLENPTFTTGLFADGSAAAPSISFTSDDDTGLFRGGSGRIDWSGNGTLGGYLHAGGVRTVDGSTSATAFGFINDINTGIYRAGTDNLGIVAGGILVMSITSTVVNTETLRAEDGTAAAPSFSFQNDTDSGMYRSGANDIRISSNGAWVAAFQAANAYLCEGNGTLFLRSTTSVALSMRQDSATSGYSKYIQIVGSDDAREGLIGYVSGNMYVWTDNSDSVILRTNNTNRITVAGGGQIDVGANAATYNVHLNGVNVRFPNLTTTASAANARITTSAKEIREVTSMGLFKDDRRPIQLREALKLFHPQAISWVSTADGDVKSGLDRRYVGWVAEQFHAAGLDDLIDYNPDGTPRSIHYDRVPAYLIVLIEALWDAVFPEDRPQHLDITRDDIRGPKREAIREGRKSVPTEIPDPEESTYDPRDRANDPPRNDPGDRPDRGRASGTAPAERITGPRDRAAERPAQRRT